MHADRPLRETLRAPGDETATAPHPLSNAIDAALAEPGGSARVHSGPTAGMPRGER